MAIKFGGEYHFSEKLDNSNTISDIQVESSDGFEHHINEPIITCVGTRSEFGDTLPQDFRYMLDKEKEMGLSEHVTMPNIDNVDYRASPKAKKLNGLISPGSLHFVISPVDSKDKYSSGFYSCIALVVVGKSKKTGENISMMLHTPLYNSDDESEEYFLTELTKSLDGQLEAIKRDSIDGSVDSIIAGGMIQETYDDLDLENYTKTKDFVSSRVARHFDNYPVVVGDGPKILRDVSRRHKPYNSSEIEEGQDDSQSDELYFDNKTRRLYLLRPEYTKDR